MNAGEESPIRFEIPELENPEGLVSGAYSNHVGMVTSESEVLLDFCLVSPVADGKGKATGVRNRLIQRIILPRAAAAKMAEMLKKELRL